MTVSAADPAPSLAEQGCAIGNTVDGATIASASGYHDGLVLKRADISGGISMVRLSGSDASLHARDSRPLGPPGLERISTRVERLGQGIAATPLVQTLAHPEKGQEPQLSMLVLAALGVVAFVARRRRNP